MRKLLALILTFALAACVPQATGDIRTYLPNTNYGAQLTPPPEVGSPAWRADLDSVILLQKRAGEKDVAQARWERDLRPEIVASALGKNFTRANNPKTFMLLDQVDEDCKSVVEQAKLYWHTDRPYQMNKRVKVLVPAHSNGAYPSGHTACSRVMANVLSDLYPKKKVALEIRANQIAQHRVIAGMHYPHDLAGGRQLAAWITRDMQASSVFQADLAAARSEVK